MALKKKLKGEVYRCRCGKIYCGELPVNCTYCGRLLEQDEEDTVPEDSPAGEYNYK